MLNFGISFQAVSSTCSKLYKNKKHVGKICFSQNPKYMDIGERLTIKIYSYDLKYQSLYVVLMDETEPICVRPKDRPAICKDYTYIPLRNLKNVKNSVGLPKYPEYIYLWIDPESAGTFWNYEFKGI
jgi:hypothetical protein